MIFKMGENDLKTLIYNNKRNIKIMRDLKNLIEFIDKKYHNESGRLFRDEFSFEKRIPQVGKYYDELSDTDKIGMLYEYVYLLENENKEKQEYINKYC